MTEEIYLEKMAEILDAEEAPTMDTVLADLEEWDSLSVVSFVALANTAVGKKVSMDDVRAAVTLGDLYRLL